MTSNNEPIVIRPRSMSLTREQSKELSSLKKLSSPTPPLANSDVQHPKPAALSPLSNSQSDSGVNMSSSNYSTGASNYSRNRGYSAFSECSNYSTRSLNFSVAGSQIGDVAIHLGDVVVVPDGVGVVRYKGTTHLGPGIWLGVELASGQGNTNGTVDGTKYFQCDDGKGVFVETINVKARVSAEKLLFKMVSLRESLNQDRKAMKKQRGRMLRQASTLKQLKNSFTTLQNLSDSIASKVDRSTELSTENKSNIKSEINKLKTSLSHYQQVYNSWKPNNNTETEIRDFMQQECNKKWYISRRDVHKKFKHVETMITNRIYDEFEATILAFPRKKPHDNIIYSVAASNNNLIVSGSDDRTMRFWRMNDNDSLICVGKIVVDDSVNCICFASDGSRVGAALHNGKIEIWDANLCQRIRTFLGLKQMEVWALIFSPNKKFLVSGSLDHKVRVWNCQTSDLTAELNGHEAWVNDLSFDPSGNYLASASGDWHIRVWDFRTFECVQCFQAHNNFVRSVCFTDEGKLISAGEDGFISVWDTPRGTIQFQKEKSFRCHKQAILCIDVVDGYVISASSDKTVRLWELETGNELECFKAHKGDVNTVIFIENGMFAISGSDDACLKLWNLSNHLDTD